MRNPHTTWKGNHPPKITFDPRKIVDLWRSKYRASRDKSTCIHQALHCRQFLHAVRINGSHAMFSYRINPLFLWIASSKRAPGRLYLKPIINIM